MSKFSIALLFATFVSPFALASTAPNCLKTVSDQDLLNEVSGRMSSRTPLPSESGLASFSCRFQTMTISLVDPNTGVENREEMLMNDAATCTQVETFLSNRIGNKTLSKPAIVAGCRFSTLMRVTLNPTGTLKRLSDQMLTDNAACIAARDRVNDAL